jgi:hypothetical protein
MFGLGILFIIILFQGCAQQGYSVIASTATVIGVEVSQNPATQTPQAKLGYNRAELAFVPSNRHAGDDAGDTHHGAKDTADVIMELRYGGIFDLGASSGIYQRLAVGGIAVAQPGAVAMFIKNADGHVDPNAAQALQAIKAIPVARSFIEAQKSVISEKFLLFERQGATASLDKFQAAAQAIGYPKTTNLYPNYPAFRDFAIYPQTTIEEVATVRRALEAQGITFEGR